MNLSLIRHARRAVGIIWVALFSVVVVFSLFTHIAPMTGRDLFTIAGGSMEPSIPLGSLVIASPVDAASVSVGDVITIRADNNVVITHRVTQVVDNADGHFFQVKGDANAAADPGLVPARGVIGRADEFLPYAGYARPFLSTLLGLIGVLSVLCTLLLTYFLLGLLVPTAPTISGMMPPRPIA